MCELVLSGKINQSIPVRLHIKMTEKGFTEGEKPPTHFTHKDGYNIGQAK